MSEQNAEIVRRVFEAVARRDGERVLSLYDRDVEIDSTWENLDGTLEELIVAGKDDVVPIVTTSGRARASGIEIEWKHHAGIWTVRDAKVVRVLWYPTRAEALEAAGLSE